MTGRNLISPRSVTIALAPLLLPACSTLGGNVKGDFVCRAPNGICAPTTAIDDQALSKIEQGNGTSAPIMAAGSSLAVRSGASETPPAGGQALKIILPARVDRFGHQRDAQVVYAAIGDAAGQAAASTAPRPTISLSELAALAPSYAETQAMKASADPAVTASQMDQAVRQAYARGRGLPSVPMQTAGDAASAALVSRSDPSSIPAIDPSIPAGAPDADRLPDDGAVVSAPSFAAPIEDE